jgi:hypothetical protein
VPDLWNTNGDRSGLFILPCFKELVCAEVSEISTMYWTPAKSGLEIFCRHDGKTFCAFGLEMYEERSRVTNCSHKRAWRMLRERRLVQAVQGTNRGRAMGTECTGVPRADMRRLTTGIRSEKCVVRRFRRCANVYLHKPR